MADNNIPLNADKKLFAENLVNYVFRYDDDVVYIETIPEDIQDLVHNAFNVRVKDAVESIEILLEPEVETIFRNMEQDDRLNEEALVGYAADLRKKCFRQGFDASNFLNYCVHIAMLAHKFHDSDSFDVLEVAVSCIMACFEDYDMFSGGWETLQKVAVKFQQTFLSKPTPSPQSDDYPEDFTIPKEAQLSWVKQHNFGNSYLSSDEN